MRRISVSSEASEDFFDILDFSYRNFGQAAADRYRALILAAYDALADDPGRAGVVPVSKAVHLFHLSRLKSSRGVKHPRHFVAFRYDARTLRVLRLFHDAMDLPTRLADL